MKQKGFINIVLIILVIILAGTVGYLTLIKKSTPLLPIPISPTPTLPVPNPKPNPTPSPIACTQEAKQCPDGSYVGRTGKNCEFAKCPI